MSVVLVVHPFPTRVSLVFSLSLPVGSAGSVKRSERAEGSRAGIDFRTPVAEPPTGTRREKLERKEGRERHESGSPKG